MTSKGNKQDSDSCIHPYCMTKLWNNCLPTCLVFTKCVCQVWFTYQNKVGDSDNSRWTSIYKQLSWFWIMKYWAYYFAEKRHCFHFGSWHPLYDYTPSHILKWSMASVRYNAKLKCADEYTCPQRWGSLNDWLLDWTSLFRHFWQSMHSDQYIKHSCDTKQHMCV